MNDWGLGVAAIHDAIEAASRESSLTDRLALYAGARTILGDIEAHIRTHGVEHGYMHEKILKIRLHMAAMLGFDDYNKHPFEQQKAWAFGALQSLEKSMLEYFGDQ